MMRSTRDGIGRVRGRAIAGLLLAGAMGFAAFGGMPGAAGADDEQTAWSERSSDAEQAAAPASGAARRLLGVEAEPSENGTLLRLRADGEITNAKTMVLGDPARLVLDLPGMRNAVGSQRVAIGSGYAERVRIGQHDDKLRVVVDGGSAVRPFEGHVVLPRPDGLWVGIGAEAALLEGGAPAAAVASETSEIEPAAPALVLSGRGATLSVAEAAAEAPAAVSASSETTPEPVAAEETTTAASDPAPAEAVAETAAPAAPGGVKVHGVQYDAQSDRDRLVIVQEGNAPHSILRPDAETLIISLQDATLDEGATIRVTPQEPGPISLVTAIQMPNATPPEVRIAIARAPGIEPTVTEEGQFLVLDFPRGGESQARADSADVRRRWRRSRAARRLRRRLRRRRPKPCRRLQRPRQRLRRLRTF